MNDNETVLRSMKKISTSSEGIIYRYKNIAVKRQRTPEHKGRIRHSHLVGVELNKISPKVPNFVRTYHITEKNGDVFSFQEFVSGITLERLLPSLSFEEFLGIFKQILIALEVAQKELSFCHYDLHLANVIVQKIVPFSYTVSLYGKNFTFKSGNYLPIIIDFGLACVKVENTLIGSYDCIEYGMYNFPIQGYDMYKFLFHSYSIAKGDLQKQIGGLFLFYGLYDPYKILLTPVKKLPEISQRYLEKISKSRIATYTPLEFFLWIQNESIDEISPKTFAVRDKANAILSLSIGDENVPEFSAVNSGLSLLIEKTKRWKNTLRYAIELKNEKTFGKRK